MTFNWLINMKCEHQELMIYDLQHYFNRFSQPDDNYNPTTFRSTRAFHREKQMQAHGEMVAIGEGIYELGFNGNGFCYDNELPEHKVYLQSYKIDINPVTNGEYLKFIEDKGYEEFSYWLADGWDLVQEHKWNAPLYWIYDDRQDKWMKKDFRGLREINPNEPVTNVSYYEADAYSRWLGKRIPSEAEWEKAQVGMKTSKKRTPTLGETTSPQRSMQICSSPTFGGHRMLALFRMDEVITDATI